MSKSDAHAKPLLNRTYYQPISGALISLVEVLLLHPLDVVKTRMQLQVKQGNNGAAKHAYYTGVLDCFAKIYKQEGLTANWKGIMPRLAMDIPRRAIKFLVFEQCLEMYQFGRPAPTKWSYALGGLTCGFVEGSLFSVAELIKVKQQAERGTKLKARLMTLSLYRQHGFGPNGLGNGLLATVLRNMAFNMVYFGFYHTIKSALPTYEQTAWEVLRKIGIGLAASILATLCSGPFDVVKSRLQAQQPTNGKFKYQGTFNTFAQIYKEEGVKAFYKGTVPRLLARGPAGALLLIGYEYIYAFLLRNF